MASLAERITAPTEQMRSEEKKVDWAEDNGQLDGATTQENGGVMQEPEFDVEVKLIDETLSQYSSASTFEELGM